jgi:WD40 repeat protein
MTPTQLERRLALTPLPQLTEVITGENINQIQQIAVWGTGKVHQMAVSRDGLRLVVGTGIGAFLYDSTTYEEKAVLPTPYPVESIAFSFDNQYIVLGQTNQTIDIYNATTYELSIRLVITEWEIEESSTISVHFSGIDNSLVSVIRTAETIFVNRWEAFTWGPIDAFAVEGGLSAYALADINLLGILQQDRLLFQSISFPDERDSVQLPVDLTPSFLEQMSNPKAEITASSGGDFILLNNGNVLSRWSISKQETSYRFDDYPNPETPTCYDAPLTCLNRTGSFSWDCPPSTLVFPIENVILTPDNIMMLILLNSNQTEFRRASDGLFAWDLDVHFTDAIFSPGGDLFFGLRPDGTIEKRSTLDGSLIDTLVQHPGRMFDLAFSPDGSILASSFGDGWIRVLSTVNGEMLGVLNGVASSLQFSPDGSLLGAGLLDGTIRVFELAEGRYFDFDSKHRGAVSDLAFSSDGLQLASSSEDCTISLWDPVNRFRLQNLSPNLLNPFQVTGISILPGTTLQYISGNRDIIASIDGTQVQETTLSSQFGFNALAFSPDGRWLAAAGSTSWLLSLTEVGQIGITYSLEESKDEGYALHFSPDGSILIIASQEHLNFWSVNPLNYLGTILTNPLTSAKNPPIALSVSPDGSMIALGNEEGNISIFAIP